MLVDGMTKQLDSEQFMKTLRKGQWSIVRDEEFVNPRTKRAPKQQPQKQQLNRRPDAVIDDAPVEASGGRQGRQLEAVRTPRDSHTTSKKD